MAHADLPFSVQTIVRIETANSRKSQIKQSTVPGNSKWLNNIINMLTPTTVHTVRS